MEIIRYVCFGNNQIYFRFENVKIVFWENNKIFAFCKEPNISILEIIKYLSFGNKQMQNFGSNSNPGGWK